MAKNHKNSGDALNTLKPNPSIITESKVSDAGILKSETYRAALQIEDEHIKEYGKRYPKVTQEMIDIFNQKIHCSTPSVHSKVFGPINLEHRKNNPCDKNGAWRLEEVEVKRKLSTGEIITYKDEKWVGGKPKYTNAELKQLRQLSVTVMQEKAKGIQMKDVSRMVKNNGYVIHEVKMTRSDISMSGSRPVRIAIAAAKKKKEAAEVKKGEAAIAHLSKTEAGSKLKALQAA